MLKFYADKFVRMTTILVLMEAVFEETENSTDEHEEDIRRINDWLAKDIKPMLEELGLRQSTKKAVSMIKLTANPTCARPAAAAALNELRSRIHDELEDGYFLHLSEPEAVLF